MIMTRETGSELPRKGCVTMVLALLFGQHTHTSAYEIIDDPKVNAKKRLDSPKRCSDCIEYAWIFAFGLYYAMSALSPNDLCELFRW